ncbi:MAG TPA: TaqI-like C-terminal specificity domain-containing protein [Flavobacterium sp.]|nr:TaqI-like C-terminal specificity domain-containing protein [Flavobacterium sp.]
MNENLKITREAFSGRKPKSISETALEFKVSEATIRNWIKTKLLLTSEDGKITSDSINYFATHILGKQRLNARSNKLQKDSHNHELLTLEVQDKVANKKDIQELGEDYENSLSDSYRNQEGIYYTPEFIIQDMMKGIDADQSLADKTFLDPCCGSGNFILEAIKLGFKPENIYGFDIDPNAVAITRKRVFEATGYHSENIVLADFLEKTTHEKSLFDYIYTNPPWGKKIPKAVKVKYAKIFSAGKSTDTASLFFFASLASLEKKGKLGFLLPDSFFNISVFEQSRLKALEYSIDRLIDYKRPFKGLMTKAQAILLTNIPANATSQIECEFNGENYTRAQQSFVLTPKSIFNFWVNNSDAEVISHLFELPHITLANNAKWGMGIVTGNNKGFCKTENLKGLIPVYKGSDITKDGLKKPTLFIPEDLGLYQQVAPAHLYQAREKIIYKFISSTLCFYCDHKQRYMLNSANFLILNTDFPIGSRALVKLLNSDFMTWIFKSIFASHKILRSDLERLPIHSKYFEIYKEFNEDAYLDYLGVQKSNGTYVLK